MATPKKTAPKASTRTKVSIGLDFRPLPIDVGDGNEWLFNPDPDPSLWGALMEALNAFADLETLQIDPEAELSADEREALTSLTSALPELLTGLGTAIAGLMTTTKQGQQFTEHGYGQRTLQALAQTLVEELTGFPTTQQ